jgi:hypothetical protein
MVLASLFFATMSVCIKYASAHFNLVELVCYRGAIGIVFMATWCHVRGVSLKSPVPMMHVWRSIVGVASLTAWFYAIAKLPLATAMTLNYMSGIWVAAFLVGGTMIMGRIQDVGRQGPIVLTVMAGFTGVIMTLRPTIEQNQLFAGLIGLLSGLGAAFAYLQVAALGRVGEPEARTVLYFSVGATVAGAHRHAVHRHQRLGLAAGLVAAADRRAGRPGATLHDARLQPGRHAGGGQPAILGHRVRRAVRHGAVRRPDPGDRLGRHGADHRQRHRRHLPAFARPAQPARRGALTHAHPIDPVHHPDFR